MIKINKISASHFILFILISAAFFSSCKQEIKTPILEFNNADSIRISLAQWSFHRALRSGEMDNFDFLRKASEMGFEGVEYVNQFFMDKAQDSTFLSQLNKTADSLGIRQLLIMVDEEGDLADTSAVVRKDAVLNHYRWIDAASFLGCHSIRVNLRGIGTSQEVFTAALDGLIKLAEYAGDKNINIIIENNGGYSSDAHWLSNVIKSVPLDNVGSLPDFDNFCIEREGGVLWGTPCIDEFDRYEGVRLLMPYAGSVSAKAINFGEMGFETTTDYKKMIDIIVQSGYQGYIGVEYEGENFSEEEGTLMTKQLIENGLSRYNSQN